MTTSKVDKKPIEQLYYKNTSCIPAHILMEEKPEELEVKMSKGKLNRSIPKDWTMDVSRWTSWGYPRYQLVKNIGEVRFHPHFSLSREETTHFKEDLNLIFAAFFPDAEPKLKDQAEPELEMVEIFDPTHGGVIVFGAYAALKFPHLGITNVSARIDHVPGEKTGTLSLEIDVEVHGYGDPALHNRDEYERRAVDGEGIDTGETFFGWLTASQTYDLQFDDSTGKWEVDANYDYQHTLIFPYW